MAIGYDVAVRNLRQTATRDYFANGTLELLTAGDVLVASFGLSASGGSVAGGVWTLAFDATTVAAAAAGSIAKVQLRTAGGLVHGGGLSVGLAGSGADVIVAAVDVLAGADVTIASAQIAGA